MHSTPFFPLMSMNSVCKYNYELTKLELRRQQQKNKNHRYENKTQQTKNHTKTEPILMLSEEERI